MIQVDFYVWSLIFYLNIFVAKIFDFNGSLKFNQIMNV